MVSEFYQVQEITVLRAGLVDIDASIFFMLVLFLVLFALLNKILLQPMLDMFDKRHALTDGAREDAAKAVTDAEARIAEYTSKVGEARREAVNETKRIRAKAAADERTLLDGVRKETQAEIDNGIADLQAQAATVEKELEQTSANLGKKISSTILGGAA